MSPEPETPDQHLPDLRSRVHPYPRHPPEVLLAPLPRCGQAAPAPARDGAHLPGVRGRVRRRTQCAPGLLLPACRIEQERRRDRARDAERARRLGEHPARTGSPRPAPARTTRATESLAPAATRDCPHCGQPVTIVALLATPEAARPTITQPSGDVITLRRA